MQLHIKPSNPKKNSLFSFLLLLTGLFIAFEISFFIQSSELYLGDYSLIANRLKIPAKVFPGIIFFFSIQLALHLVFTIFIWALARLIGISLKCSWKIIEKLGLNLWMIGILTIILANQYFYPNSKFSALVSFILPVEVAKSLLFVGVALLCLASLIGLWGLFLITSRRLQITLVTMGMLFSSLVIYYSQPIPFDASTPHTPNIVLIGIDALRPDFLGYFGFEKQTPHLDHFLNNATVFANALTPIARTFPAWVSILSGEYPKHSGVRFNLTNLKDPQVKLKTNNILPHILRKGGYQTVFATDDVRFSNIDEYFGFDKTTTPPVGFNDFLLGTLNDFPMANLLVNTPVGKYLFPYSYGNRAVYTTYYPDSFLRLLQDVLSQPRQKPLFLAVHFCLPHFPYVWGSYELGGKSVKNYYAAVQRVDKQFNDFLQLLKQNKLLENSIVILISDHGEALELPGDRVTDKELFIAGKENKNRKIPHFYPVSFDFETVNQSAGHGTDVLGLSQYHSLLAFRFYGSKNYIGTIPNKVSLLDIKPTLLDLLHLASTEKNDGISRADLILQKKKQALEKDLFLETDYSPQAIRTVHPESRHLLFEGIDYFQIDPQTTRIQVKPSMGQLIISSKQYADIYGDWILALYPQNKTTMMPILVNLRTGNWTNDLSTSFAKQSPVNHMLASLRTFYRDEITQVRESFFLTDK